MKNLSDMNRDELKGAVRDMKLEDEIDLRASTSEIRERLGAHLDSEVTVVPDVTPDDVLVVVPPVITPAPPSASDLAGPAPARIVRYYRVERFAKWVNDGVVYALRAGAFVNDLAYPIELLRAQGVPLVEVERPDDSDPGVGHRFT